MRKYILEELELAGGAGYATIVKGVACMEIDVRKALCAG